MRLLNATLLSKWHNRIFCAENKRPHVNSSPLIHNFVAQAEKTGTVFISFDKMFFNNKKILVTGGTGHLGSALIHVLVNEKGVKPENIRVFYLKGSPKDSLNDIPGLDFVAGDVTNIKDVENACRGVNLVFHTVGLTTFDPRQKKVQWLVNVEGTRNVLNAMRDSPSIEKLCYTSTVNALGVPNPVGSIGNFETSNPYTNTPKQHSFKSAEEVLQFVDDVREWRGDTWVNRIGIGYYDSKLAAQELVSHYARNGKNIVSVLPGTMFGPYDHLIGTGIYILAAYRNQMPAVLKGAGMPLAHIMDVARGHILAMEKAAPGSQYILSGKEEDNRTLKDMLGIIVDVLREKFPGKKFNKPKLEIPPCITMAAAYITEQYAKLFNQPMTLSRDAVRAGSNPLWYTSQNAREDLGYDPQFTFRQAVSDMVDYYVKHGLMEQQGRWIDRR